MNMVDIGEIRQVVCVKAGSRTARAMVEAQGEKGNFRFSPDVAFSCGRVVGSAGRLWDVRLDAWIRLMQICHAYDFLSRLKKGDVVNIPEEREAWEILRKNKGAANCCGLLTERHDWRVPSGERVTEPDDFRLKCALRMLLEANDVEAQFGVMREYAGREGDFLNAAELEFVLEWHDLLEVAARTVNAHVDANDFMPNMAKMDSYFAFANRNGPQIDKVSGKSDYAAELLERHNELLASRKDKWRLRIGQVVAFRPSRFPGTRISVGV